MNRSHLLLWIAMLVGIATPAVAADAKHPNILFIAVDDLRPQLGCYGQTQMKTPHIDALAKSGVLFSKAYCQTSVCGASRASLMTGIRPAEGRFRHFAARADKEAPGVVTMGEHFKKNGYHTRAMGKIFHFADDNAQAWSEPHFSPPDSWPGYHDEATKAKAAAENRRNKNIYGPPWEFAACEDNGYPDGRTADQAILDLKRLKEQGKPFFMALGFAKPHLPFTAPKKYWDMYDHAAIPLAKNGSAPKDAPRQAMHDWRELRGNYSGMPRKGPCNEGLSRNLVHAYYACVSYMDAQVGKVLDELDQLGLADNTIVILWGDHGYQLGDHGMWCKHCVFETSLRVPLIIRAPGATRDAKCEALTELVDMYPTLCDLAGIPKPDHLEGLSMAPLMKDPKQPWKKGIYGSYGQGWSVSDGRYVYSEFRDKGRVIGRMLYDHQSDPDENLNVVDKPENKDAVDKLSRLLKEGYKSALPDAK
ncbi:MAG: sulfatase [Planctomycetes bacterium]|nr:sulfatase [Planctomycetota bacterium]